MMVTPFPALGPVAMSSSSIIGRRVVLWVEGMVEEKTRVRIKVGVSWDVTLS